MLAPSPLEPLLGMPNVTLLDRTQGYKAGNRSKRAHVTGVVCATAQGEERWTGDIVVAAAGAVNTAAMLQASANPHPERPRQWFGPGRAQLYVPHPDRRPVADRCAAQRPSPRPWR